MKCIICGREKGFIKILDNNYDPICYSCRRKMNYSYDVSNVNNIITFDVFLKLNKNILKEEADQLFQYYNPIEMMMFFQEKQIDYNVIIDYESDVIFEDEHTLFYRYNYE